MRGQQVRPGERPERRPAAEVPFFAPPRGEFDGGAGGSASTSSPFAGQFSTRASWVPANPGPGPFPGGGAVLHLEPVAGLGQAAVGLAVAAAAADVVSAVGMVVGPSPVGAVVALLGGVGFSVALLAAFVVTALWLGRARRNAQRITAAVPQRRAAAWVWFGWFVPVAFLFVPHQVVSDVWTASRRRAPRGVEAPLGLWWAAWLLGVLSTNLAFRVSDVAPDGVLAALAVLEALFFLAAVPLFRSVVRAVGAAQRP